MNRVSKETVDAVTKDGYVTSSLDRSEQRVKRTVHFATADDATLRKLLDWHNRKITREQLLAACHNRGRCGYYIEIEEGTT